MSFMAFIIKCTTGEDRTRDIRLIRPVLYLLSYGCCVVYIKVLFKSVIIETYNYMIKDLKFSI